MNGRGLAVTLDTGDCGCDGVELSDTRLGVGVLLGMLLARTEGGDDDGDSLGHDGETGSTGYGSSSMRLKSSE